MQLTFDAGSGMYRIRSYLPGAITINEHTFNDSVIISPNQLITSWPPRNLTALHITHCDHIFHLQPEVVLLGTGPRLSFPDSEILNLFMIKNIGIEVMDTGAACRTYSILMAEGRHVVAALLIE